MTDAALGGADCLEKAGHLGTKAIGVARQGARGGEHRLGRILRLPGGAGHVGDVRADRACALRSLSDVVDDLPSGLRWWWV